MQDHPSDNFFQTTAYRLLPPEADPDTATHGDGLSLGPIALNSDILTPNDGDHVPAGPTTITGYALAGNDRGIARVDVSFDDGRSWRQADLHAPSSPWSWCHWHTILDLPPDQAVAITARAWDTTAAVQPEPSPAVEPQGLRQQRLGACPRHHLDRVGMASGRDRPEHVNATA